MTNEVFVSIDSGTSVVKAVVLDADCKQVAIATVPNTYSRLPGNGAEQDMASTWANCVKVLVEVAGKVPDIGKRIVAISVTGQGDGTWLVDKTGEPVGDALLWLDVRSADVVREAKDSGALEQIYLHTGCGLNACNQSAQLAWLIREEPGRVAAAETAMHCKDWLYYKMTGERFTDRSEGLFTFGDIRSGEYCDEILELLGLSDFRRLLPPMIDGSVVSHPLGRQAAEQTGLPEGVPVSLGSVDVICSALGGGIYAPNESVGLSIIGSTGMHMRFVEDAKNFELPSEPSGYTVVPGGFPNDLMRMQSNMSATLNIDWLARTLSETAALFGATVSKASAIAKLDEIAAQADTNIIYHPYIQAGERGPFLNPDAKAQFAGLDVNDGVADLARAVFNGLAFACRHCYESAGGLPGELRLCGGGSRSRTLRQALANVLGVQVRASTQEETSAVGTAMMAAVASGHFPDMAAACRQWPDKQLGKAQTPQDNMRAHNDEMYEAYKTGAVQAAPVWRKLAASQKRH